MIEILLLNCLSIEETGKKFKQKKVEGGEGWRGSSLTFPGRMLYIYLRNIRVSSVRCILHELGRDI